MHAQPITTCPAGLAAAAIVFLILATAWRFRLLGGGDVKLLTACALVVPPPLVPALLVQTSMAGGLLGLIYLAARGRLRAPQRPRGTSLLSRALRIEQWRLSKGGPLPYAAAIAVALVWVLADRVAS